MPIPGKLGEIISKNNLIRYMGDKCRNLPYEGDSIYVFFKVKCFAMEFLIQAGNKGKLS